MPVSRFSAFARRVADLVGSVYANYAAMTIVAGWVMGGVVRYGFKSAYQDVINTFVAIITFLMVFIMQHTQNHDTKAIHVKLDALIEATKKADNCLISIEEMDEEQLAAFHKRYQAIAERDRSSKSAS